MPKIWNNKIPGTCNGRTRNVYMAYTDGSESTIALAGGSSELTKQAYLHSPISAYRYIRL